MKEQERYDRNKQAALAPQARRERAARSPHESAPPAAPVCETSAGNKLRRAPDGYRAMVEPRSFSWWWPRSSAGSAAFGAVIGVSALTLLAFGPFAIVNVLFWYLVAVFVRFVCLQATGTYPKNAAPTLRGGEQACDADQAAFTKWRGDHRDE